MVIADDVVETVAIAGTEVAVGLEIGFVIQHVLSLLVEDS